MTIEDSILELLVLWEEGAARGADLGPADLCPDRPEWWPALADRIAIQKRVRSVLMVDDPQAARDTSATGQGVTRVVPRPDGVAEVVARLDPPQRADELGRLGPYRVLAVLGSGGMGVIFRAEEPALGRLVALKVMRGGADHATARERFLREAKLAASLEHDHVVPVFQVGEAGGLPYLAMPLLRGETLAERLDRDGKLSPAETARVGREAAEGLAAAHAAGLIHRDVKPANLWLEGDRGRVKLLDFGLARGSGDATITGAGAVLGTPAFMAPEQARGEEADGRADLFSLGCTLYRCATGRLPFAAPDAVSTLLAVARDTPPPPHAVDPDIPVALSAVIVRLLAKDRTERPATARVVADELATLQTGDSSRPAEVVPEVVPAVAPVQAPPRKRRRVAVAAVFPALIVLGGVIILIKNKDGTTTKIEAPDGATVEIQKDGKTVGPGAKTPDPKPAATPDEPVALAFDGKTSHVVLPFAPTADPHTVEAWVKFDAPTADAYGCVACAFSPARGVSLFRSPQGLIRLGDRVGRGQDTHSELKGQGSTAWVHVAGVWDGKTSRLYVNGARQPHERRDDLPRKQIDAQDQPWMLGASRPVPGEAVGNHLVGRMREVRFSAAVRYDQDFTPAARHAPDKDTFALYRCDEGGGDQLKDSSGNNRHGKITAAEWVTATDPDRKAAEMVIALGGFVQVNDIHRDIRTVADLPKGVFRLTTCNLNNRLQVTDASLEPLKDCKHLLTLGLGGTQVTDTGLAYFKDCQKLKEINLRGCGSVTDKGLAHFANCTELEDLDLVDTPTGDDGLAHFKDARRLQHLGIGQGTTDVGLAVFKDHTAIQCLVLASNKITDAGLVHFKGSEGLTRLDLAGGKLTDAGLAHFKGHKKITWLKLNSSNYTDEGAAHFRDCQDLEILELFGCSVTDECLAAFKNCRRLKSVDLRGTPTTDAALAHLAAFPKLEAVGLVGTKVTKKGVEQFAQTFPNSRIEWDDGRIEPTKR